jgi:uncharacterized iron-regulated protein
MTQYDDSAAPRLRAAARFFALLLVLPGGCAAPGAARLPRAPQEMPLWDGRSGAALGWPDLMAAMESAEVVILGEQHDDGAGHGLQLALVREAATRWPGTALSMEMLERDEQPLVDDYLDGIIDAEQLARDTFSTDWGGKGSWAGWYQPIIDAARDGGGGVVAANAPRRYVRLARLEGFERLDELPPARRRLVEYPQGEMDERYRQRFHDVMSGHGSAPAPDPEELEGWFRGQVVWDATMAHAIAEALRGGAARVIHLVGQFHCDFEGGTVQELRRRAPGVRVLVVSVQATDAQVLRPEDVGRADVVVYSGAAAGRGRDRAR